MRIAHLSSVHPRYDTRIFLKECSSLLSAGHDVRLVVADGRGDEVKNGITIHDVGRSKDRLDRMRHAPERVLGVAVAMDAHVYHLHDPELLPIGLTLKRNGKRVVFDAHEDVPRQVLAKPYLNRPGRWLLSKAFGAYERWACRQLDGVIAATPFIRDKFHAMGVRCVDVSNFPLLGELASGPIDWSQKRNEVCYLGGIGRIRGILEIVKAMGLLTSSARLQLGGTFSEPDTEARAHADIGWHRVDDLGWLDRAGVAAVLQRSVAGLVTLHPVVNYLDSLPIKMFEYMSAGVPVIASDFPMWREIIDRNACGLCVNPMDVTAIAEAIDYLATHSREAERMGRNGQKAVEARYNWNAEGEKLIQFYATI